MPLLTFVNAAFKIILLDIFVNIFRMFWENKSGFFKSDFRLSLFAFKSVVI